MSHSLDNHFAHKLFTRTSYFLKLKAALRTARAIIGKQQWKRDSRRLRIARNSGIPGLIRQLNAYYDIPRVSVWSRRAADQLRRAADDVERLEIERRVEERALSGYLRPEVESHLARELDLILRSKCPGLKRKVRIEIICACFFAGNVLDGRHDIAQLPEIVTMRIYRAKLSYLRDS